MMSFRRRIINTLYGLGRVVWDTPTPAEIRAITEGPAALPTGRALDVGCGTGTNVIYLAQHGWQATGVDFAPNAIRQAQKQAENEPLAQFLVGDVTKLRAQGVQGPFQLVIDNGCLHTIPFRQRDAFVQEVAAVMSSSGLLMMWEIATTARRLPGGMAMRPHEVEQRYGAYFTIENSVAKDFIIERRLLHLKVPGMWYWLRRT